MLFILEMANNHKGSLARGKKIIDSFKVITDKYPQFNFAFKFQRRNLENLIHKDHINDDGYIKRFRDTQLSLADFTALVEYAKEAGYQVGCTPFDEVAVSEILPLNLDFIKIGSCSINDWPLLNCIADSTQAIVAVPIIASIGGIDSNDIANTIAFFQNRQIDFSLMYCVGLYPTANYEFKLDRMDEIKKMFPDIKFGLSSHEIPQNFEVVKAAIAKGCEIFERHVDIDYNNEYSILPSDLDEYLVSALTTLMICEDKNTGLAKEKQKLDSLKRGLYFNRDVKAGETINRNDIYCAMPVLDSEFHYTAFDCSKYTSFEVCADAKIGDPLLYNKNVYYDYNRDQIQIIHDKVKTLLDSNYITYPKGSMIEISHHYGIDCFNTYGMSIITLINKEYCKKLLVLLPNQLNLEHYHKEKTETFFILHGTVEISINGNTHILQSGDMITINPMDKHTLKASLNGAIIEELSTKHNKDDSYYTDQNINKTRKTTVYM